MNDKPSVVESVPAESWSDFLTPEQRLMAVAEIMAEAALLVLNEKRRHGSTADSD